MAKGQHRQFFGAIKAKTGYPAPGAVVMEVKGCDKIHKTVHPEGSSYCILGFFVLFFFLIFFGGSGEDC